MVYNSVTYIKLIELYGSERKAAKALNLTRSAFRIHCGKMDNLCYQCLQVPPKLDKGRCEDCLSKCKTKKSKDLIKYQNQEYYAKNREEILSRGRLYRLENLDKYRKGRYRYDRTLKGKLSSQNRRSRRRSFPDGKLSHFEMSYIQTLYNNKCFNCDSTDNLTIDHLLPLSKGNPLSLINTSILCNVCNSKKRDLEPSEFFSESKLKELEIYQNKLLEYTKVQSVKEYLVKELITVEDRRNALNFIKTHHYSKSSPNYIKVFSISYRDLIIGICGFSKPSRQNITINGDSNILELSRLVILDGTPKNAESYFIGKCLRFIVKLNIYSGIVSYADSTQGHIGTIYKASNFTLDSIVKPNYYYLDSEGKRIHKKTVWDRAKVNLITEKEQSKMDNLIRIEDKEKYKYIFRFKIKRPSEEGPK